MQLVYISPVPLTSFAQRPHHFVEWFHHRFNARVLWLDPGTSRLPRAADWRRLFRREHSFLGPSWASESWIEHLVFPSLPLEPLALGRAINRYRWRKALLAVDSFVTTDTWLVAGKPCALALELGARYPRQSLVFDAMDSVPAFSQGRSNAWMQRAESELVQRANWIVTSSTALEQRFAAQGSKVRKAMNGLDVPRVQVRDAIATHLKPVMGYVGVMASWFDWEAVIRLAVSRPDVEIRLIGPCEQMPNLRLPPNIHLLGAIAHDAVYEVMSEFTVGLIPFRINALTEYVDPVKYYEYRAVGLPVLSTKFGEMKTRGRQDGVFFFEDLCGDPSEDDFWCARATAEQIAEFCAVNSWGRRFDALDFFYPHQVVEPPVQRPFSRK